VGAVRVVGVVVCGGVVVSFDVAGWRRGGGGGVVRVAQGANVDGQREGGCCKVRGQVFAAEQLCCAGERVQGEVVQREGREGAVVEVVAGGAVIVVVVVAIFGGVDDGEGAGGREGDDEFALGLDAARAAHVGDGVVELGV